MHFVFCQQKITSIGHLERNNHEISSIDLKKYDIIRFIVFGTYQSKNLNFIVLKKSGWEEFSEVIGNP